MPGIDIQPNVFKDVDYNRIIELYTCTKCKLLLRDPVQPYCGHRICQSCADEIIANEIILCCPECGEIFDQDDGELVRRHAVYNVCALLAPGCSTIDLGY